MWIAEVPCLFRFVLTKLKVVLHRTIRNDDFKRSTALQHCRDIVSNSCNIVPTLCYIKSGRFIEILWAFLIEELFHSRLLDMRWLLPTRRYAPCWLATISYPTRSRGIIVKYDLYSNRFQIRKQNNYDKEGNSQYRLIQWAYTVSESITSTRVLSS